MDAQSLQWAVGALRGPLLSVQVAADTLDAAVSQARTQSGSPRQELDDLAFEVRADLQQSLKRLRPASMGDTYVDRYIQQVDDVHRSVVAWLQDGLGAFDSRDQWMERAARNAGIAESLRPFANQELHRLRVEITGRYAALDEFLNDIVMTEFYTSVCDAITGVHDSEPRRSGADLGFLLGRPESAAADRVACLLNNLRACDPPVPGLVDAVSRLSGIRFDFRLQSYPVLHDLSLAHRPVDGPYPPDFDDVDAMYEWFSDEARQYSYQISQALAFDADRQFKVLSGAAVVFEDEVIRSGRSREEFRNLADGYRDELWPSRFDDLNSLSARARTFSRAVVDLKHSIDHALEGTGV